MSTLRSALEALQQHLSRVNFLQFLAFQPTFQPALSPSLQAISDTAIRPPVCMPAVSCTLNHVPFLLDPCCINDPSGHFLQTQFWDTSPALGGSETWTIHGLWPDYCEGGFDQFCNNTRSLSPEELTRVISNASSSSGLSNDEGYLPSHPGLMDFMTKHWLSNDHRNANLWAHEWNKHGTCISTLDPVCYAKDQAALDSPVEDSSDQDVLDYFTHAAFLYSTLPTYEFFARHGILPSHDRTYDLEHLQRAIRDSSHGGDAIFRCRNGELNEIWYSFHARASLRNAMDLWNGNRQWNTWMPAMPLEDQRSSCPQTGIRYLPKDGSKAPPMPTSTGTATTTATHTATPSARPFTGKGRLMVKVISDETSPIPALDKDNNRNNKQHILEPLPHQYTGCLLRHGTWYLSHSLTSCAIFTAQDDTKSHLSDSNPPPTIDSPWDDPDANYHLFTLSSRYAPCSFIESPPSASSSSSSSSSSSTPSTHPSDDSDSATAKAGSMQFLCANDLPIQTILSNDASIGHQHTEAARRLTLGAQHKTVFYADRVPQKIEQVRLWTDNAWGERRVRVEIYWEGV